MQRVAVQSFDAYTINGLRFLLGGLILFKFTKLIRIQRTKETHSEIATDHNVTVLASRMDRKSWIYILLGGALLFGGAGLQQIRLEITTAGNAGFISTQYIVRVPLILVLFWPEKSTGCRG